LPVHIDFCCAWYCYGQPHGSRPVRSTRALLHGCHHPVAILILVEIMVRSINITSGTVSAETAVE
jgi:hypothetical protein